MRLNGYLVSSMLKSMLPVMLMLLALFSFLALAEELEDVGKGTYTTADALAVVALTLPNRLLDLLPVMLLLGALIGLGGMAGHSELTAARSIGRSPWQLVRPPMLAALAVGVSLLLAAQYVVPVAEREAERLRAEASDATDQAPATPPTWTRADEQIVRIGEVQDDTALADIEIYAFADDALVSMRQVDRAEVLDRDRWQLQQVRVLATAEGRIVTDETLPSETRAVSLPAGRVDVLRVAPAALSLFDLWARIRHARSNALDAHGMRVLLWQRLSLPLAALAMMLLALPFVFGSTRVLPIGERVTFGVIAGVAFYLAEQVSVHLAVLYRLSPMVLALLPELTILSLLALWLWRFDRT